MVARVDLGIPWLGWPVRCGDDYSFGTDWESSLVSRIDGWARVFDANVDEVRGWNSTAVRLAHLEDGVRLKDELQSKLGPGYEVVLDPIGGGAKPFGDELEQSGA